MTKIYDIDISVPKPSELGGGHWNISNLAQVTVLFGKNGSGKSKLLRQWKNIHPEHYHYVLPERAGEIDYQASYLNEQLRAEGRQSQTQRNFSGEYRRHIIARISAYFAARGDYRGTIMPTDPSELEALIAPLLPDFELKISGRTAPPFELKRLSDNTPVNSIDQLSSGETQALILALDVLTIAGIWDINNTEKRILLIDEPDAHIHPDLQVRFADFLVQVANRFEIQIVVATHSTTMLSALGQFAAQNCCVLYLDRENPDLKANKFDKVLRNLSSCLGGHVLMGPLFGEPILLVEGDDDYRIWSQVPRYHKVRFAVIPGGGDEIKKHQKSLEQIFSALMNEKQSGSAFALIDADKGKPRATFKSPQNHVKYIQLVCHESENLYLSDEVIAQLGHTWPTAVAEIVRQATKFGTLSERLLDIASSDRSTVNLKGAIEAISQILDAKKVLWTIRVAKAIGSSRPSGQLGYFLGNEVVNALWGPK